MTDYKTIRGKKIKSFATDLGNDQAEGQIFYSETDNKFKTAVAGAAWHSSGPLLTGRSRMAGCGSLTAGLGFGGYSPNTGKTEEYNGSGWSESGDLNTARYNLGGCGTQTAGLGFAGYDGSNVKNESEEYNGSSWTEGNNVNTARQMLAASGTQDAALGFGGYVPSPAANKNETEEYNGTSWSEQNNLNTARRILAGAGTQTAGLAFGGYTTTNSASTEEYDGTSWTASNNLNTARHGLGGAGIQTSALAFGGSSNRTEQYNGTSWTETGDLATSRSYIAGFGPSNTSAVAFGGSPNKSNTEEFNVTVNTVTAAAFSAGGNLNTARSRGSGGGTLTAGICVNGITVDVEEYNGTSWSEQNNMPTALRDMSGFGTQTAFVGCAGYQPGGSPVNTGSTYEYDGSNWTSGGTMNVGRDGTSLHFGGVLTAGLVNGGGTPPYKQTEEYNGTSWSNANASSQHHYRTNITGTQTAAFIFGGYGIDPGGPQANLSVTFTEEYDGTNFSSGDSLLQGANAPLGMSNSNKDDSTCAGGFDQASGSRLSLTQNYNGTAWATGASLGTARYAGTGGGSAAGGFVAAGNVPPNTAATEELTAETTSLNLKTITDS